ncbi:putative nucleotidyltransferase [Acetoanaerobium pronyense]|uniref:tRNA(Met) cytidine acetate ligase n=1 Tax=Acetoanaerobium pronyense TaxID=1482736 RepID=A0ABS4KG02_9FIRM|nr:nucleotidyltransferase [Acetoanaerobium pronyense]MBP2026295.1 putative nucleotidyltransferase [Acetoanaerobium pronyense]
MTTLGIIVEYNPFHNGHLHHIKEAKKLTGATHVVGVMSGNFVQRGGPALIDKWSRASIAVECGVDLVLELPVVFSSQSAEIFAKGSISTLEKTGVIDYIVFGSESNSIENIYSVAKALSFESENFKAILKDKLQLGISYPKAREEALKSLGITNLSSTSNDILGIEYVKQLINLNSSIKPLSIQRTGSEYNSLTLEGKISSATAIREFIKNQKSNQHQISLGNENKNLSYIDNFMPHQTSSILYSLMKRGINPIFDENFFNLIRFEIIKSKENLKSIYEIEEGLENRIYSLALKSEDFNEFIFSLKTKRYTLTRLRRILFNILLGIQKKDMEILINDKSPAPYFRVLSFNQKGREILKQISQNANAPIINKVASYKPIYDSERMIFKYDTLSTRIYNLVYNSNLDSLDTDFLQSPIYTV